MKQQTKNKQNTRKKKPWESTPWTPQIHQIQGAVIREELPTFGALRQGAALLLHGQLTLAVALGNPRNLRTDPLNRWVWKIIEG